MKQATDMSILSGRGQASNAFTGVYMSPLSLGPSQDGRSLASTRWRDRQISNDLESAFIVCGHVHVILDIYYFNVCFYFGAEEKGRWGGLRETNLKRVLRLLPIESIK